MHSYRIPFAHFDWMLAWDSSTNICDMSNAAMSIIFYVYIWYICATVHNFQWCKLFSLFNRELQTETDKKRRIANKLKENDKELTQARTEIYKLKAELKTLLESKEHLEQDVKHHEEEVRSLQKKIKKLEEAIVSPTASKNSALRRLIAESPAPADFKRPRLSNPDANESNYTSEKVILCIRFRFSVCNLETFNLILFRDIF